MNTIAENNQRHDEALKQVQENFERYKGVAENYDAVMKAIADISDDYLVFVDP